MQFPKHFYYKSLGRLLINGLFLTADIPIHNKKCLVNTFCCGMVLNNDKTSNMKINYYRPWH